MNPNINLLERYNTLYKVTEQIKNINMSEVLYVLEVLIEPIPYLLCSLPDALIPIQKEDQNQYYRIKSKFFDVQNYEVEVLDLYNWGCFIERKSDETEEHLQSIHIIWKYKQFIQEDYFNLGGWFHGCNLLKQINHFREENQSTSIIYLTQYDQ